MSYKAKLSLVALCVLASGVAGAATTVGTGTIDITGNITSATCVVSPDLTAINIPTLHVNTIGGVEANGEIYSQTVNFNFSDCSLAEDTMVIKLDRNSVGPPTNVDSHLFAGGFTYVGGSSTDSTAAPLYYRVSNDRGGNMKLFGDGDDSHNFDISAVEESEFSLPVTFRLFKSSHDNANQFVGSYSASLSYTITYP